MAVLLRKVPSVAQDDWVSDSSEAGRLQPPVAQAARKGWAPGLVTLALPTSVVVLVYLAAMWVLQVVIRAASNSPSARQVQPIFRHLIKSVR